jgi:FKBP-type peptidyl-prolyl cis-trans isomerase FkpA
MTLVHAATRHLRASILVLLAATAMGCNTSPSGPSFNVPFSQSDLRPGSGDQATAGQTITVQYTGWLFDEASPEGKGLLFETSAGTTGFTFPLGVGQVIPGWDQGLPGMRVGGLRRLIVPPSLAYGGVRQGRIPPNSTLVFDVELIAIAPAQQ